MSRIIVDAVRNSSASADGITLASDGSVTLPGNATCSGTATGFGGGKLLQVKQSVKTDTASWTGTSFVNIAGTDETGAGSIWEVNITPTVANSKILVEFSAAMGSNLSLIHI